MFKNVSVTLKSEMIEMFYFAISRKENVDATWNEFRSLSTRLVRKNCKKQQRPIESNR